MHRRYLRQSVTLTSFGSSSMREVSDSIRAIHNTFLRTLPDNSMEDWSASLFEGYEAIDMGNRYFTHKKEMSTSDAILFKSSVDPNGILQGLIALDMEFGHTQENEVQYFEMMTDTNGPNRQVSTLQTITRLTQE
jgi:hypothetical protein